MTLTIWYSLSLSPTESKKPKALLSGLARHESIRLHLLQYQPDAARHMQLERNRANFWRAEDIAYPQIILIPVEIDRT